MPRKKILIIKSLVVTVFVVFFIAAAVLAMRQQPVGNNSGNVDDNLTNPENCVSCHRQQVESRQQVQHFGSDINQTKFETAKPGANCADCHGAAAEHVQAALAPLTRASWHFDESLDRRIIQPQKLDSDRSMLICASCHGLQNAAGENHLRDVLQIEDSLESKFWADGSPRIAEHEYQGVINSPCFLGSKSAGHSALSGEKINCLSCHAMHETESGARLKSSMRTNQACTQCHEQFSDASILQEHTKHAPDSQSSNCISCHMPEVVYGEMAFHPTHQISNPQPEMTALKGVPNACNQCHVDQSVNWAINATKKMWAGYASSQIAGDGQFNQPEAVRMLFAGDALTRALAAENLRKYADPEFAAPFLAESFATEDYPIVRFFAANALISTNQSLPKPDYLAAPEARQNQINLWFDKIAAGKLVEVKILAERLRRQRKNAGLKAGR